MEDEARAPVANDPASGGGGPVEVNGNGNLHDANGGSVTAAVEMKRKRGRPSKSPDQAQQKPVMVFSPPPLGFSSPNPIPPVKRGRGRPKGSVSRPRFPLLTPPGFSDDIYVCGVDLTPHILPIYPGEDVHGKILSFAQNGSQAVTVLSCTGPVASISICSPGSTGGMIYEGRFEILTLNGSFTCAGNEGSYHRKGRLTVTLAKPNGQVFGGCVSGPIIAAGPIQLVLGSYDQVRRPSAASFTAPNPRASDHCQGAGQDNVVSSLKSEPGNVDNGGDSPSGVSASAPCTGVTSSPQPQPEPAEHRDTEGQVDEAQPLHKTASNVSDQ